MDLDLSLAKQAFITESRELLQDMESILLVLEKSPDDEESINSLFRAAHTIKGSSGVLGIEGVEKFTHSVESVLSKVRDKEIKITAPMAELLLECRDHIYNLVLLATDESATAEEGMADCEKGLVARLNVYLDKQTGLQSPVKSPLQDSAGGKAEGAAENSVSTDNWHISVRFGKNVLRDGMDPISFINYLPRLGEIVHLATLYDSMPKADEMDPESCYLGVEIDYRSDFDKQTIEDVFEFVRADCQISILPPHSRIESYIELISGLPEDPLRLGEILIKGGALTRTELDEALNMQKQSEAAAADDIDKKSPLRIGDILVDRGMVHPEVVSVALDKQKKAMENKSQEARTIRVDADKIDKLVNLVGELVISNANIEQHAQRVHDGALIESASVMARLVEEVRDITMKIRMVPIGETFIRFKRVVRDISRELGKEVDLDLFGGETELDKAVIEKIGDPLMHLVRNAIDHGIETPAVRTSAGKVPKGTINLNAFQDSGGIVIEVSDDGKGLNRKKIMEKAIAVGLVANGQSLSDKELFRLIFEPGFSTAEKVSKLSGRGVGMDVVKKNIEALRGTVEVESSEGQGTTVRIKLPLTLAIIDGFMVGVGDSAYVIPLDMVVECVELSESDREVSNKRSYINLRGELLPYIRLRDFLGETGKESVYENIVVVNYAGNKIGLVIDKLFGEVQAVIKSLGRIFKDVTGVSGSTILGDGTVALILDVPRMIQSATQDSG